MKLIGVLVLAIGSVAASSLRAQAPASDITFKDEIRQFVMKGDDTAKVDISLTLTTEAMVVTPKKKGATTVKIPYSSITGMTYDRRSRVRKMFVGTQGVSKAEDHFLTIQYKTESGAGDFIEVELGKNSAPRVLASLEARSGKKIDRSSGS
jgi:hypothetical protein